MQEQDATLRLGDTECHWSKHRVGLVSESSHELPSNGPEWKAKPSMAVGHHDMPATVAL